MDEAETLRRPAKRALRIAELILDQQATEALKAHAPILLERAESLEQAQPESQQQHQISSTEKD